MENVELWANMNMLEHANIFGHNVWVFEIGTSIGYIYVEQYEGEGMEVFTKLFYYDKQSAEKLFRRHCHMITDGKIRL